MRRCTLLCCICVMMLTTARLCFAGGTLVASFDIVASKFVADPYQNIIYASSTSDNSVVLIDMESFSVIDTIFVGSMPAGLTISPDGDTLYVALKGSSSIAVVNLVTRALSTPISLPSPAFDVELGNTYLYATPGTQSTNGIMQIDLTNNTVSSIFSETVAIYTDGMLEVSPDRNFLYFANSGLSPGTLAIFDISAGTPALVLKNPHGDLGSNGQDLQLSQDGMYIYYAVGGGNWITGGYDIGKLDTDTLLSAGALVTGAYPREITLSPDGSIAYVVHTSGHIDVWDCNNFLLQAEYPTSGQASELIVDKTGGYLLAAFENSLRIYAAEGTVEYDDADVDGIDDRIDNCVGIYNPDQIDSDSDGFGDLCDPYPYDSDNLGACLTEADNLFVENNALLAENAALHQQVDTLLAEKGTLQSENVALQQQVDTLLTEKSTLQQQVDTLLTENSTLQTENAALQQQINSLLDSMDSDGDGVSDLYDICPGTILKNKVDANGCSPKQL